MGHSYSEIHEDRPEVPERPNRGAGAYIQITDAWRIVEGFLIDEAMSAPQRHRYQDLIVKAMQDRAGYLPDMPIQQVLRFQTGDLQLHEHLSDAIEYAARLELQAALSRVLNIGTVDNLMDQLDIVLPLFANFNESITKAKQAAWIGVE